MTHQTRAQRLTMLIEEVDRTSLLLERVQEDEADIARRKARATFSLLAAKQTLDELMAEGGS